MGKNGNNGYAKGRGKFENPIELKYIQIPRDVLQDLFINFSSLPENSRMLALWHFCYHYLTNQGFDSLKLKDMQAYLLCLMMNEKTFVAQNNARWKCWDEFYRQEDIDFDLAMERYQREKKEKKAERNKNDYNKRKLQQKTFEQLREEREAEVNKIIQKRLNKQDD